MVYLCISVLQWDFQTIIVRIETIASFTVNLKTVYSHYIDIQTYNKITV